MVVHTHSTGNITNKKKEEFRQINEMQDLKTGQRFKAVPIKLAATA